MKQITLIILSIIILTTTASALNIYPGETIIISNDMGIENLVYTIVGNTSEVKPFDVQIDSENITITFPQDMIPDSYEIIFLEEQTKTVVETITVGGGGGGTRTIYKDRNITKTEIIEKDIIKEVPGETIIEEKVVEKIIIKAPAWAWILIILLIITLIILVIMMFTS